MTPFWHPLSAALLTDPSVFATPHLARLVLGGNGGDVVYAGDRMWPALRHGERVRVDPADGSPIAPGEVVLAAVERTTDLLRVKRAVGDAIELRGDADPSAPTLIRCDAILGSVVAPRRARLSCPSALLRRWLDLAEALAGRPDPSVDASESVRSKYEAQAPYYESSRAADLDPRLVHWVRESVAPGGTVLVVGSGTGREALGLVEAGFRARGIDYAPAMVAASRREAARRGVAVSFDNADLRLHDEPPGSLDAVFFTYDVYSFLPGKRERIAVLTRLRAWLADGGAVFLSARLVRSGWQRAILTLQRARGSRGKAEWGDSHTRWIDPAGALRRSFVHYFEPASLDGECASAGFELDGELGGHRRLRPRTGRRC